MAEVLEDNNGYPSSATDDVALIQSGLGLYTKVEFPSLPYITELKNAILVKALLFLEPVEMSNWDSKTTEELRIFGSDNFGGMGDPLIEESGLELMGNFNLDELYNEETYFVYDITSYLLNEISDEFIEPEISLYAGFSSTALSSTLERISMSANSNESKIMKLELTFFQYDQ